MWITFLLSSVLILYSIVFNLSYFDLLTLSWISIIRAHANNFLITLS